MDWHGIGGRGGGIYSWGEHSTYLVSVLDHEVRLSRFSVPAVTPLAMAAEAACTVIVFPLGRGPGRPGGEPELDALAESAKVYAERYEAGESLEGYPHWQHERSVARFLATGNADDCPNC
jgi:hypothetical protein